MAISRQLRSFGIMRLLDAKQPHPMEQPKNHSGADKAAASTQRH
jgi:hypothetical protein